MEEKRIEPDGQEIRQPEEIDSTNTGSEDSTDDVRNTEADDIREDPVEEELVKEVEGVEPPPIPKSVDDAWAEALGVPNNVPPIPNAQPSGNAQSSGNAHCTMHNAQSSAPVKPWMQPVQNSKFPIQNSTEEPMPSTWLVWSVVCTILCCFVPGIVAIIQSSRVSSRYYQGDIEGAKRASRNAEIWIIISFVLGVLSNTLYLPLAISGFMQ